MMQPKVIALVDCDNFFVSCERLLEPKLEGVPVIVLSNNDGCVISRSQEAKALGIKMGEPFHFIKGLVHKNKVQVFSGHFTHYTQISKKVASVLKGYSPQVEVYSVDEAFLDFSGFSQRGFTAYAHQIYQHILQNPGVPVSIGIGYNKTQSKLSGHWAKQHRCKVFNWVDLSPQEQHHFLQQTPVFELWGVGWRLNKRLNKKGIMTAHDLMQASSQWVLKEFGTMLARTHAELHGDFCIPLVTEAPLRKSMIFSRSFGEAVCTYAQMKEVIATYVSRVCEKLRREGLVTQGIGISIKTSPFRKTEPQYKAHRGTTLRQATDCTYELSQVALELLQAIYKPGYPYRKAGAYLWGLIPKQTIQLDLFSKPPSSENTQLMQAVDALNRRFGSGKLHYASEGFEHAWQVKKQFNGSAKDYTQEGRENELFMSTEGFRFL